MIFMVLLSFVIWSKMFGLWFSNLSSVKYSVVELLLGRARRFGCWGRFRCRSGSRRGSRAWRGGGRPKDLGFLGRWCFGFLRWLPLARLRRRACLCHLFGGLLAGVRSGCMLG